MMAIATAITSPVSRLRARTGWPRPSPRQTRRGPAQPTRRGWITAMTSHVRSESRWIGAVPILWSGLLAVLLLGPALAPGLVLSYDMVWVPDLALRPDFLGVASGLPRAVPSDAVVAVLDEILPGQLLQKVVLLASLVGGGLGIARLLAEASLTARLAAITVYQWSPFVAERLVIGHWPVLVGYAVLPWLLVLGRRWRVDARFPMALAVLVPLGSLSASAGVATGVALLAAVAGRDRRRVVLAAVLVLAANAPWLVSGLPARRGQQVRPGRSGRVRAVRRGVGAGTAGRAEPRRHLELRGGPALAHRRPRLARPRRAGRARGDRPAPLVGDVRAARRHHPGRVLVGRDAGRPAHLGQPGPGRLGRSERARWRPGPRRVAAAVAVRSGSGDRVRRWRRPGRRPARGGGGPVARGRSTGRAACAAHAGRAARRRRSPARRRLPGRLRRGQGRHRRALRPATYCCCRCPATGNRTGTTTPRCSTRPVASRPATSSPATSSWSRAPTSPARIRG